MEDLTAEQLRKEIAAIWARLYYDYVDDAKEMARMLTTAEQRQAALEELNGDDKFS